MTRPLRIVYEERPSELFAKGELHKAELEALAQNLLVTVAGTGVAFAQRQADPSKALLCIVSVGRSAPLPGAHVDPELGISGRCVREGRMQKSYDTLIDPRVDKSVCQQLAIRSLAVVPLLHRSRCIGLLEAFSDRPGHFDGEKMRAIELTASRIGELLGYEAERSIAPDNDPELIARAVDLNLINTPEPRVPDSEQREPSSIAKPESLSYSTNQEELSKRSRRPVDWVIAALVLFTMVFAALTFIVRSRHTQPLSPRPPSQNTPSFPPSPTPPTPTTPARSSAPTSAATPKAMLVERAGHGDVAAQLALADTYQKGNGVPRDPVRAITWYVLAGANGNTEAKRRSVQLTRSVTPFEIGQIRYNVGRMYVQGMGVKQDYVSAYSWFELAKAQGEIRAQGEENKLQSSMTAGQIRKAKTRAAKWMKLHRQRVPATGPR